MVTFFKYSAKIIHIIKSGFTGNLGGSIGPAIVGRVTQSAGDNIRAGLGVGLIFPVVLLIMLFAFGKDSK